jgi:hypothetical protein
VAEEGALVTWRVRGSRPVGSARLVTSAGDTVPLRPDGADARTLVGAMPAAASALYQVVLDSGALAAASDYHRLSVTADAAPTVAVLAPAPRSEIARGQAPVVEVVATVSDDYRVASSSIVATVTSGSGEAVRFREQVLAFESSAARAPPAGQAHALTLRRRLDLAALGMGPGDELYFHVRATDNRRPSAHESRSETYFVSLADTAQTTLAAVSGIALNVAPEYFRSQRQIIIDTEKLIADRPRLRLQEFRDRSNEIGADQHLLRVRYGEIVGDEMAEGDADPQAGHQHDTEENATLLAASVKTTLQAALAEMWQAELKLRTYEPVAALPYENRALELLKQVQQAARSYVQRVGFEPPPLEPDRRRLRGELKGIHTRTVHDSAAREPADTRLRSALAVLQRPGLIAEPGAADLAALEDAGRELGRRAVGEPGPLLATLRDVRRLHDALAARRPCPGCAAAVERGLWSALGQAEPSPSGGSRPASALGRRYFELLQAERAP